MDHLEKGQLFTLNTSDGLNLRREPVLAPETEDGQDNIIPVTGPTETVTLKVLDVDTIDERRWYNVQIAETDVTGWIDNDSLQVLEMPIDAVSGGEVEAEYIFMFENMQRLITEKNLNTAFENKKFSAIQLTDEQFPITFSSLDRAITGWTTRENLKQVTFDPSLA